MRSTPTRLPTLLLGAALVVGSVLVAAPAQAHDSVVSSTPAAGATVAELPAAFSVSMNDNVLDIAGDGSGSGIQVTDAAGRYFGDGCITVTGPTVSMPATLGGAGVYRMVWQLVSSDGHPTNGEFSFSWAPAEGVETVTGSATPPVCGADVVEETPEPTEESTPEPSATAEVPLEQPNSFGDALLWGGLALLAVVLAVGSALLVTRKRTQQ